MPGDSCRAQVIAAVREAREALAPRPGTGSGPADPAPDRGQKIARPEAVAVLAPDRAPAADTAAAGA